MPDSKVTSVKFRRIDDLAKFVSVTPAPFLNHAQKGGKHLYFLILPFSGGLLVYYYSADKKIDGDYVTLNRMSGAVSWTNKPSFEAQALDLPILEVEATDLLDEME